MYAFDRRPSSAEQQSQLGSTTEGLKPKGNEVSLSGRTGSIRLDLDADH